MHLMISGLGAGEKRKKEMEDGERGQRERRDLTSRIDN